MKKSFYIISISIFFMFMSFVALGNIVKSNSASKKTEIIQATGDAFPNPYITDGLIAMWDGEWNKAIGVHDDSATTWNDLTGNRKHTFILVQGNYVWTDNALFGLDRSRGRLGNLNISSLGEVGTIECVVNPGYGHDNIEFQNGTILEGACDAGTIATRIRGYASGKVCQVLSGKHYVPWYSAPGYLTKNEDRIVHFGSTIEGTDTDFCFFNGNATRTYYYQETWATSSLIILGAYRINDERYPFYGPIYCIRIYSRKLSPDEIAYNFSLDQERFGIQ